MLETYVPGALRELRLQVTFWVRGLGELQDLGVRHDLAEHAFLEEGLPEYYDYETLDWQREIFGAHNRGRISTTFVCGTSSHKMGLAAGV